MEDRMGENLQGETSSSLIISLSIKMLLLGNTDSRRNGRTRIGSTISTMQAEEDIILRGR